MSEQGRPDSGPSPEESLPREARRSVALEGYAILEDGSTHAVTVLDLSYDGCGIEVPVPLEPGHPIRLSVSRRGVIDAEVRWYSQGKAGLVFKAEQVHSDAGHSPRDSKRILLDIEATIKRRDRPNYRAKVKDVSPKGLNFEFVDKPEIGETVLVRFDGLQPLEAMVRWIEGPEAGARFERPMHPAVFALLLERLAG